MAATPRRPKTGTSESRKPPKKDTKTPGRFAPKRSGKVTDARKGIIIVAGHISRYVSKLDPAVSGQGGHNSLLIAAGALVTGFALSDEQALPILIDYNQTCMPPWTHGELRRKLKEARKRPKKKLGYLLGDDAAWVLKNLLESRYVEPENTPPKKPNLSRFRTGYTREFEQMSANRAWSIPALKFAQAAGVLRFGRYFGFDCYVVMGHSGICAEARRLDDKPFPACKIKDKEFEERKANAIGYSKKDWPVGLHVESAPLHSIVLVEGSTDLLSAYHFVFLKKRPDILPVTMLGKGMALHGFHPDAHERLRNRRVRICPDNDQDGGGLNRALHWAKQLVNLGCKTDFFVFDDVIIPDGQRVKDLTDCIGTNLEELFP